MAVFVNCTNHPVRAWSPEQVEAAKALGFDRVVDLDGGMPLVPPMATRAEVRVMARRIARTATAMQAIVGGAFEYEGDVEYEPLGLALQGEPTLTVAVLDAAREAGVRCFAATTDRVAVENVGADGTVTKTSVFCFVQWRQY